MLRTYMSFRDATWNLFVNQTGGNATRAVQHSVKLCLTRLKRET